MAGRIQCETAAACEELAAWQQAVVVDAVTVSIYALACVAVGLAAYRLYGVRRAEE